MKTARGSASIVLITPAYREQGTWQLYGQSYNYYSQMSLRNVSANTGGLRRPLVAVLAATLLDYSVSAADEVPSLPSVDAAVTAPSDSMSRVLATGTTPGFALTDSLSPRPDIPDTVGLIDTMQASSLDAIASSAPPRVEPPPEWLVPAGEVLAFNVGLWAYNRYYKRYGFAHINLNTMVDNLGGGWVWDEDQFSINQFGHPYQGSFYFSSARYHGHDFYTSTAYTALGSLHWEYFMEAEKPSYNDLLTTTLGGAMLGEISFRLSNALLDPRSTGVERVARELGATAVNPINGLNRLISGETFKGYSRRTHPRLRREDLIMRASSGGVVPFFSTARGDERTDRIRLPRANSEFLVMYGDEFNAPNPYDYFILNLGINVLKQPVSTVSARAQIMAFEIYGTERQRGQLLIGQNFDYLDNGVYKLGVSGIGVGYAHVRAWGTNWFHTLHTQAGAIPLGGVSTEYFRVSMRDYNLGGGAFSHTRVLWGQHRVWHTAFVSDRYWLRTRSGAKGDELIGHFRYEVGRNIWSNLGAVFSMGTYDRVARTRDHGRRAEFTQEGRLLFSYTFY
jgi:hypothetical protein